MLFDDERVHRRWLETVTLPGITAEAIDHQLMNSGVRR